MRLVCCWAQRSRGRRLRGRGRSWHRRSPGHPVGRCGRRGRLFNIRASTKPTDRTGHISTTARTESHSHSPERFDCHNSLATSLDIWDAICEYVRNTRPPRRSRSHAPNPGGRMSTVTQLKQSLSSLSEASKRTANALAQFDQQFNQQSQSVQNIMQGSSQSKDKEVLAALQQASRAVKTAAEDLNRAARVTGQYGQSL